MVTSGGAARAASCLTLAAALSAAPAAAQERLALECDDDGLGASTVITYIDSSPEFHVEDALRECGPTPGTWSSVIFATETDAAAVQATAEVASEPGDVLRVHASASLAVGGGTLDLASVAVGAEAEAFFTAPDGEDDLAAELVVEIERHGEFEDDVLELAVVGPSLDRTEDLGALPDGASRIAVRLEAGGEYAAWLASGGALTDSGSASHTVRLRVETVPVPEPSAAWLAAAGAAVLAASRGAGGTRRRGAGEAR